MRNAAARDGFIVVSAGIALSVPGLDANTEFEELVELRWDPTSILARLNVTSLDGLCFAYIRDKDSDSIRFECVDKHMKLGADGMATMHTPHFTDFAGALCVVL